MRDDFSNILYHRWQLSIDIELINMIIIFIIICLVGILRISIMWYIALFFFLGEMGPEHACFLPIDHRVAAWMTFFTA